MPDVVTSDELNALAAEYALGTLDYEERNGASALLEVDHEFRDVVRAWERQLGELHLMVEPVEPDATLWERIKAKAADTAQLTPTELLEVTDGPATAPPEAAADAAPDEAAQPAAITEAEQKLAELAALLPAAAEQISPTPPPPPPSLPQAQDLDQRAAEQSQHVVVTPPPLIRRTPPVTAAEPRRDRKRGRGWMATALLTSLVAIALACLIGAWRYFPERLPPQLSADTLLKLGQSAPSQSPPPAAPAIPAPPKPAPFDE